MKKFMTSIVALLLCIAATAQTEFRHISYKEALAAAKSENKKVFLDFYTDWCGPCKMMLRDVFPQKNVGDFMNTNFVAIKVNAEKDEGVEIAKKYKITAYPTFVILDANEKEVGRVVGGNSAEGFINKIEQVIDPSKSPELIKQKYADGDRSAEVVKTYASILTDEMQSQRTSREEYFQKSGEISNLVQDYFSKLSDADKLKDENMFVYRQYTDSPFTPSGRFLCANVDKFPEANKAEADSLMRKNYKVEVLQLLSGDIKYDAANYETLKKEIKACGLDKEEDYSVAYSLIEAEAKGDKAAYINACDKNYSKLTDNQRAYLMETYSNHFKDSDEATKLAAAKFIRKYIGELEYNEIYFVSMQIGELEGKMAKH